MITLSDSIEVEAPPERVFAWLVQCLQDGESYRAWHPDHVDLRWIKGEPLEEGSIAYADEYLHGKLHRLRFRITKVAQDRLIEYRPLFPWSILAPGNRFLFEPRGGGGCVFTATGSLRVPRWLFERPHRKGAQAIEAVQRHMKEEGENLKRALEERAG